MREQSIVYSWVPLCSEQPTQLYRPTFPSNQEMKYKIAIKSLRTVSATLAMVTE